MSHQSELHVDVEVELITPPSADISQKLWKTSSPTNAASSTRISTRPSVRGSLAEPVTSQDEGGRPDADRGGTPAAMSDPSGRWCPPRRPGVSRCGR